jgi:hypothetical protein
MQIVYDKPVVNIGAVASASALIIFLVLIAVLYIQKGDEVIFKYIGTF